MKTGGIHITLCCEHCGERVPKIMVHSFPCPHCNKKCEPNGMVAEALLNIGKTIQAMSPIEQAAMLRKSRGDDGKPLRMFPLMMTPEQRKQWPDAPQSFPWGFIAPFESQARANHDQTLARLAELGGLDPIEMVNVFEGKSWDGKMPTPAEVEAAVRKLTKWRVGLTKE